MKLMELYKSKKLIENLNYDVIKFNTKQLDYINLIYLNTQDKELREISLNYMNMLWKNLKEITIKRKILDEQWKKLMRLY